MNLAPSGVPLVFEVTFDSAILPVAMSVYDTTPSVPVLVQGPTAMVLVAGYTYRGKFTAQADKSYVILKAVYTSGAFTTLDPNYSQGSESIYAQVVGGGGGGEVQLDSVVGYVDNEGSVIGLIDNGAVIGLIDC